MPEITSVCAGRTVGRRSPRSRPIGRGGGGGKQPDGPRGRLRRRFGLGLRFSLDPSGDRLDGRVRVLLVQRRLQTIGELSREQLGDLRQQSARQLGGGARDRDVGADVDRRSVGARRLKPRFDLRVRHALPALLGALRGELRAVRDVVPLLHHHGAAERHLHRPELHVHLPLPGPVVDDVRQLRSGHARGDQLDVLDERPQAIDRCVNSEAVLDQHVGERTSLV
jgi:hypothetical protein